MSEDLIKRVSALEVKVAVNEEAVSNLKKQGDEIKDSVKGINTKLDYFMDKLASNDKKLIFVLIGVVVQVVLSAVK